MFERVCIFLMGFVIGAFVTIISIAIKKIRDDNKSLRWGCKYRIRIFDGDQQDHFYSNSWWWCKWKIFWLNRADRIAVWEVDNG